MSWSTAQITMQRHRRRNCWRGRRCAPPISREAIDERHLLGRQRQRLVGLRPADLVLGGAAAFATGRAIAKTWSPLWLILPAMIVLAAAVRFLHFALFQEDAAVAPLLPRHAGHPARRRLRRLPVDAGAGRWRRNIPGPSKRSG